MATLHLLRNRYNNAKHNSNYIPTIDEVVETFSGAVSVLTGWKGRGIGTTESSDVRVYRRRVWMAAWDHFASGDGEVHVFLPVDETEHAPRSIDVIYVRGLAWPDVLTPLGSAVQNAKGVIPDKFIQQWENDGDCAGARVFEGDYRDLIKTLVGAELVLDLIGFLKREADYSSMRTALAFAAVDVAAMGLGRSESELIEELLHTGASEYAAPRTAFHPKALAPRIARLILAIPLQEWSSLRGPRFVTDAKFRQSQVGALITDGDLMIANGPELVIRLDD